MAAFIRSICAVAPAFAGLKETIAIAQAQANIPGQPKFSTSIPPPAWIPVGPFIQEINQARAEGVDITANGYPYVMGWTYWKRALAVLGPGGQ